jgi:hypothetical protein
MVNGNGGRPMVREILYAIAAEYGWPEFAPPQIEMIRANDRDLETMPGTYRVEKPEAVTATVRREGSALVIDAPRLGVPTELAFLTPDSVIALDAGDRFTLIRDAGGRVTALDFGIVKLERAESAPK